MKCPACKVELERETYEDRPVFHCQQCRGYLVNHTQLRFIKGSRQRNEESLEQDAVRQSGTQGQEPVRCPKCLAATMNKKRMDMTHLGGKPFQVDVCKACRLIWFDGGELAKLQLNYELSDKAIEELEMQVQAASRTPQEQAEFERTLADVPHSQTGVLGTSMESIWAVLCIIGALALLVYYYATFNFGAPGAWIDFVVSWQLPVVVGLTLFGVRLYRK